MKFAVALLLVGACYSPDPQPGITCANGACPPPLVCSPLTNTCERTLVDAPVPIDAVDAILIDGCTPSAELCGDGIDQDCDGNDPTCAANDAPSGAIDISMGGTFMADLSVAHDDVGANGCGGDGGRDLFFKISLGSPRVFYLDTFGSTFDTVIRVYTRSCANVGSGANARACENDSCGTNHSQVALSLPAGDSCVVIDQESSSVVNGSVTLHVLRGERDGMPLASGMQTSTGDTCSSTNIQEPVDVNCDGPGALGKDLAYFITRCPGQTLTLDANICPEPAWDPVLYVRRASGAQIACNDDTCNTGPTITNVNLSQANLFWLYVDGFNDTFCGTYNLHTYLR